jgi:hypothetical protein
MRVDKEAILMVLDDKWSDGLTRAFCWNDTLQRAYYWNDTLQRAYYWGNETVVGPKLEGVKALLEIVKAAKCDGRLA